MEIEKYISGYCRQLDNARMVEVIIRNGQLEDADCCYFDCIYRSNCPIAKEIEAISEK